MSTLAIAMIVKDEAELTPAFLQSVSGLWDELVVVDTGSVDGTPSLFRAAGARVFHAGWEHDFARARNVALEEASADWVLVLDADERPGAGFGYELRRAMEQPGLGALTIHMVNALPYGHVRESHLLRAWRRDARVRFRGAIHEEVASSLEAVLRERGELVGAVHTPVEHLGYVRTRAAARDKKHRDVALLRRMLQADALDLYSHLKLLEQARFWRDGELMAGAARAASEALVLAGPRCLAGAPWGGELVALIAEGLFEPASEAGLALLRGWLPRVPPHAALHHRLGQAHEARGEVAEARTQFERCLELSGAAGDLQLLDTRPLLGLARLELMEGRAASALDLSHRALGRAPRDPEALLAVATLTLGLQGLGALEAFEAHHQRLQPVCPERDWVLGEVFSSVGALDAAVSRLRRGAGVPPGGPAAVRLAQVLLARGDVAGAESLVATLWQEEPEAGLGVLVLDLLAGRDTQLELALTPRTAEVAMRRWVEAVLASGRAELVSRLKVTAPVVAEVFPWLPSLLAAG